MFQYQFQWVDKEEDKIWTSAFNLWLKSLRTDNTKRAYKSAWIDLLNYCGNKSPRIISRSDITFWFQSLKDRNLIDSTIAQKISSIGSFYAFANKDFVTLDEKGNEKPLSIYNPASARIFHVKINLYNIAYCMSIEETTNFLNAIPRDTILGLRDYALLQGYLLTGRRNSEWRQVKWGDFHVSDKSISFQWSGKGKKLQKAPCVYSVWESIINYLKSSDRYDSIKPEHYIFVAHSKTLYNLPNNIKTWEIGEKPLSLHEIGRIVHKYAKIANIRDGNLRTHDLRHTAASLLNRAGVNLTDIRDALSHSSVSTTDIYLRHLEKGNANYSDHIETLLNNI